jgi:hypothetical protein
MRLTFTAVNLGRKPVPWRPVRPSSPQIYGPFPLGGSFPGGNFLGLGDARVDADRFARRSVLDIGTFDGFYSFLAEARGASRVVAVDNGSTWGGCALVSA